MSETVLDTPRCPGSLKEGFGTYCPAIIRNLFQNRQVFHVLNEMPYSQQWQAAKVEGSFFGERIWFNAELKKNRLIPNPNGEYLIKTSGDPVSGMRFPYEVPANEHLCLQIANQVYNLEVLPNALIFFPDGEPALIIRYHPVMKSFVNFHDLWNASSGYKRSREINFYQQISDIIDQNSAASLLAKERFFKQVIFMWLIANGTDYTKSSGLVKTSRGDWVLAPLFSSGCSLVHELVSELAPPGFLFDGDRNTNAFMENGHYTSNEFESFARRLRLPEKVIRTILNGFIEKRELVTNLIRRAFLPNEAKAVIQYHFSERIMRLK